MSRVTVGIKSGPGANMFVFGLLEPIVTGAGPVRFVLAATDGDSLWAQDKEMLLHITGINRMDRSGMAWSFEGNTADGTRFAGDYRTDTREGRLTFEFSSRDEFHAFTERMGFFGTFVEELGKPS